MAKKQVTMETVKKLIDLFNTSSVCLVNGVETPEEDFNVLLASILLKKTSVRIFATSEILRLETVDL